MHSALRLINLAPRWDCLFGEDETVELDASGQLNPSWIGASLRTTVNKRTVQIDLDRCCRSRVAGRHVKCDTLKSGTHWKNGHIFATQSGLTLLARRKKIAKKKVPKKDATKMTAKTAPLPRKTIHRKKQDVVQRYCGRDPHHLGLGNKVWRTWPPPPCGKWRTWPPRWDHGTYVANHQSAISFRDVTQLPVSISIAVRLFDGLSVWVSVSALKFKLTFCTVGSCRCKGENSNNLKRQKTLEI